MKTKLAVAVMLPTLITLILYHFVSGEMIIKSFPNFIRGALCAGFIAIMGIFFNTRINFNDKVKHHILEHKFYQMAFEKKRMFDPKASIYSPLRNLGRFFNICIGASGLTALIQVISFFYVKPWTILVCVYFAILSIILLVETFIIQNKIENDWTTLSELYRERQP